MEKYNQNKGIITLIGLLLLMSNLSCKKFVQIPPPETQVVTETVFNNNGAATSAQLGTYSYMVTNALSYQMATDLGLYSDELQNFSTNLTKLHLYTNSLQATDNAGQWATLYKCIFYANSVLDGLKSYSGTNPAVKQQLTGEALFVRAFCNFNLASIYGDIPLVTSTDPNINDQISRSPKVQVYQQVISDLQNAKNLLNVSYVDGTDTAVTSERVRPTKFAALALLARTYLYLGDYSTTNKAIYYTEADSASNAVIGNNVYALTPLTNVFLKNSSEAIWQLQTPSGQTWDTYDGAWFILTGAPGTGTTLCSTISTQLLSSFEVNDQRKINWIGSIQALGNTYYFPYKYKNNTLKNQEYTMVLRLGEQYLIRAEARNRTGNVAGALSDLNAIRTRAGLGNYTGATDQVSLETAILHERQVELFSEWGHRWFDLARTGNAPVVMTMVSPQKGGTWYSNNYQMVFPIPQTDISNDNNLSQNTGY